MNSFITWVGGKKALRKEIINRFPTTISRYIEVFGGAAWVLFGADRHAELEVYNDVNSDLVNLFRCVKYHCGALQEELSGLLNSREIFADYMAQRKTRGYTDIQRAARFYATIRMSYGADARSYGCGMTLIDPGIEYLQVVRRRLERVVIEHKDFDNLIKVYDRPEALYYCDPPYHGTEAHYTDIFSTADHERLRAALGQVKGRWLLSYNDDQYIRELYAGYTIEELQRPMGLTHKDFHNKKAFNELLIRNY